MAIFGSTKMVDYTKTGDQTSSSNLGFENGPLQKWINQPSGDAGFESIFEFGTDILTTLYPDVVFGGWKRIPITTNVFQIPRGKRFQPSDVVKSYTLDTPATLQPRSGAFDNIYLNNILTVGKVYQGFEIRSTGANYIAFELGEALENQRRAYEDQSIHDLISGGSLGQSFVESGKIYETLLNLRKQLVNQGSSITNVDLYCTPDVVNAIMQDSHYISNGQAPIAAQEVRNGFMGRILGFNVIESGRLSNLVSPAIQHNIIAVDVTQVIMYENKVKDIALEVLPAPYIDCVALQGLTYFKHYIVNQNGVWYFTFA